MSLAARINRAVSIFSPALALKRETAAARAVAMRRATNAMMAYDGATAGRRAQGWRVVSTDANAENLPVIGRLRDVARDMVRNNPHAARARNVMATNVIGEGIKASITTTNERDRADLESLVAAHLETPACDAGQLLNVYGLQELIVKTVVESGEAIVRYRGRRRTDGLPLPFAVQVLEPDYIDTSIDGDRPNGNRVVQGIEFDGVGRRVAYWLFSDHPGASGYRASFSSKRIPAQYVAHIYRVDRPGQVRGVTWFSPVILKMRDLADYADAQLMRQKIAACFAAFITTDDDPTASTDDNAPVQKTDSTYDKESLEPGIIQRLRAGEDVSFADPPSVGDYESHKKAELRDIAVGLGMSYEALSGDLSGVNFSSGRMGWLEFQRTIRSTQANMVAPMLCDRIGAWFLLNAQVQLGRPLAPDTRVKWTAPAREMINPSEENKAASGAIRAGLSSRSHEVRKRGFDPAELDDEIAADNRRADDLGLIFDSDPRRVTSVGNASGIDAQQAAQGN